MASNGGSQQNRVVQDHGYDVELASGEQVDVKYMCPVCLNVMRDAMQTVCGHRFCKSCITRVAGDKPWGRCPVDKTALRRSEQLFNDVAMRREILSLKVKCKNSNEECTWTGEIRDSEKHLKECPMENVQCPIGCQATLRRGQMTEHKEECPQRTVICSHCKESIVFVKVHKRHYINVHYCYLQKHEVVDCPKFPVPCTLCGQTGIARAEIARHMDSTTGSCPQANVVCKFRSVGCHFQDKRKDMQKHYDSSTETHLSMLMNRVVELTMTNDLLREELCVTKSKLADTSIQLVDHSQSIKQLKERTISGRLLWKLDMNNMNPLPNMVFSPPFYTSCPGYQLRLRLDFRGVCDGDEVYSSIFVVLQKGEFDADLLFPFNGQVRVSVLPHSSQISSHCVSTIVKCKDIPRNTNGNVNARMNSRGCTRFIKQKELLSSSYSKNKIVFFDISMVADKDPNESAKKTTPQNILVSQVPVAPK
ncbi:TNF receptor-associated factor 6-like [Babylonia areolata]|uniref:TNF receptor-associated factor 6-like n=1 Tax=Babylonia areolata TaxID=304850 RepID=UPI003FD091CE